MGTFLRHILGGQHQFASDGLLLMLVGGAGVYLRAIPERLWSWISEQLTLQVTVKDDDVAFVWVKEWFLEQKFLTRVRRVDLDSSLRNAQPSLVPAHGRHWFWHAGRPFVAYLYRSGEEERRWSQRQPEWLTFRTIGRRQAFLQDFVRGIVESHERSLGLVSSLYVRDDDYWERVRNYSPRRLESVILRAGEKEHFLADISRFKASQSRYAQLGVPYHRGYLLYGPPGTGKTSLVSAFAAKFGMSVYLLNLTDFDDKTLMKATNDVPANSVILLEDIDCMRTGKARPDMVENPQKHTAEKPIAAPQFGVTLSGLLNVLDGLKAPESVLFVMTTNSIETLDRALLRPGRIDYRLYLGKAEESQKIELYRRFFSAASEAEARQFVAAHHMAETMAEFQGLLLGLDESHKFADSEAFPPHWGAIEVSDGDANLTLAGNEHLLAERSKNV